LEKSGKQPDVEGRTYPVSYALILFCFALLLTACRSDKDHVLANNSEGVVCVVLAHPDDETILSGTLSMLTERGFDITIVYVTSGDDGPDETGQGLFGSTLGTVREKEALQALGVIGIKNPPKFLRFPDGHVQDHADSVFFSLNGIFSELSPQVVIGFGPDGITGADDHRVTGYVTDSAFNLSESGRLLLHMAVTKPLPPFFAGGVAVPKSNVDVSVNVSKYAVQRSQVVAAHHTQFNSKIRSSYKVLVHTMRKEKFIVAGNRNAGEWVERCF